MKYPETCDFFFKHILRFCIFLLPSHSTFLQSLLEERFVENKNFLISIIHFRMLLHFRHYLSPPLVKWSLINSPTHHIESSQIDLTTYQLTHAHSQGPLLQVRQDVHRGNYKVFLESHLFINEPGFKRGVICKSLSLLQLELSVSRRVFQQAWKWLYRMKNWRIKRNESRLARKQRNSVSSLL